MDGLEKFDVEVILTALVINLSCCKCTTLLRFIIVSAIWGNTCSYGHCLWRTWHVEALKSVDGCWKWHCNISFRKHQRQTRDTILRQTLYTNVKIIVPNDRHSDRVMLSMALIVHTRQCYYLKYWFCLQHQKIYGTMRMLWRDGAFLEEKRFIPILAQFVIYLFFLVSVQLSRLVD